MIKRLDGGLVAELVVAYGRRARLHAEKMVKGIRPEQFAQRPVVGGQLIETNHPAFVYGHLSPYPARVLVMLGFDSQAAAVPVEWTPLFRGDAVCWDDPTGRPYPPMDALVSAFLRAHDAALAGVLTRPDDAFMKPQPDETYRNMFPLVGNAVFSMLNNHVLFHVSQVSAWRRCMGLGSAE